MRKLGKQLPALQRRRRFYVDATGGNDANSGRSPADAWQTIGKANAGGLRAGDRCLFKRGEVWTGTRITAISGVTYGTYGSGAKPVIDGDNLVDGCAVGSGKGHVRFENIKVINALDYGFSCLGCFAVTLYHCESDGHGNDGALFMTGAYNCKVQGGTYQNAYQRIAGPTVTGIEVADGAQHDTAVRRRVGPAADHPQAVDRLDLERSPAVSLGNDPRRVVREVGDDRDLVALRDPLAPHFEKPGARRSQFRPEVVAQQGDFQAQPPPAAACGRRFRRRTGRPATSAPDASIRAGTPARARR